MRLTVFTPVLEVIKRINLVSGINALSVSKYCNYYKSYKDKQNKI